MILVVSKFAEKGGNKKWEVGIKDTINPLQHFIEKSPFFSQNSRTKKFKRNLRHDFVDETQLKIIMPK